MMRQCSSPLPSFFAAEAQQRRKAHLRGKSHHAFHTLCIVAVILGGASEQREDGALLCVDRPWTIVNVL